MVIALFILMVLIFLTAEYFSFSKKISAGAATHPDALTTISTAIIERYYHRGHSWALIQSDKNVVAGVDDFSQRFIGKVESVELPESGSTIRQGETMITMKRGDKSLSSVAPVSGIVLEVNPRLVQEPSTINSSPLEKGWIVKISPLDLAHEVRDLFKGVAADRWQEGVRAHLVQWLSPHIGVVMQDGGNIIDNVSDLVNSEEWCALVAEFFPKNVSNTHNDHT